MHTASSGEFIGEYQLDRLLGSGGAGLVFLARHVRLGHYVVIKLLRPDHDGPEQRARFLREGQALARLHHPGIVRLLHADTLPDGTEYLVMEHAEGVSLRQLLLSREAPLSSAEVARILAQVAAALSYAHDQGVVHRDIKPENLMVRVNTDTAPGGERLKLTLIDFGLAWLEPETVGKAQPWPAALTQLDTHPGARPGTVHYRAPELGLAAPTEDTNAQLPIHTAALDTYSLGVVGWELLTSKRPAFSELSSTAQGLRAIRPDVATPLAAIICAMLSPVPESRPAMSQVAMVTACEAACQLPRMPTRPTRLQALAKKAAHLFRSAHLSIQMTALFLTGVTCLLFLNKRHPLLSSPPPMLPFTQPMPQAPDSIKKQPLLLITQPSLGVITDAEIQDALGSQATFVRRINIAPLMQLGAKLTAPNWDNLGALQAQQVSSQVLPALQTNPTPRIVYFGMAPVPLSIQLGTLLGGLVPVSVFQRIHQEKAGSSSWHWPGIVQTQQVELLGLPQSHQTTSGPVVMRISASFPVDPALTRKIVADPLCEIDISLSEPSPDALQSEADVHAVAAAVRKALDAVAKQLPNTTAVHLFAAVPGALALRIGMATNPNIHPPLQTYHYDKHQQPVYQPALLLHTISVRQARAGESMPTQTAPLIERRLETFVDWLKPDADTEAAMAKQAHEIRDRIRAQAATDKLTVRSTPGAGSFAKNTGLRRHVTGGSEVEGQDVDIPFVLAPMTEDEQRISRLLDRFQGYADRAYPQRPPHKSRTKSSIKIAFERSKLSFDLVPMIQAKEYGDDYQWLLRGDGTKRLTSVERHNVFIKTRTNHSNQISGRVKFNECVRLLKWWRDFRMAGDRHSISGMPSILIEMLAAYAFDHKKVQATYSETLLSWFDFLHGVVAQRKRIFFADYPPPRGRRHAEKTPWMVIEPVDPENNLTHKWIDQHIDELAGWLQQGRIDMQRAVDLDRKNNPQESLHHLVNIFGTPFKHHCGS
jgi:serine/threonine protein kinase